MAAIAYQSAPREDERGEEKALEALKDLKDLLSDQQKSALEAIISAAKEASTVNLGPGGWFEEHNKAQKDLKDHYTSTFKDVPSLFASAGEPSKEVDTLQFTLKLIEPVDKQAEHEAPKDDVTAHHARSKWQKTTIAPEDLFKSRSTKPGGAVREINKVLVVGDAGMGKTTLSKQLAYRWAKGEWGTEFEAVYVLPVRNLSKSYYDNAGYRREATLATAIVNLCFTPPTAEEDYKGLLKYVDKELKKPTTLVILDGLDERAGACESLIGQAKQGDHKLLMLSRSYGITEELSLADIQVEHAGLSDEQMRDYVIQESLSGLPEDKGKDLLSKIANHPSISEMAHVPVNLAILCFLWRDQTAQTQIKQAMSQGSLPELYRILTQYTWERYVKNAGELKQHAEIANQAGLPIDDRDTLFDTLGKIALEAFKEGEILISQRLVGDLVNGPSIIKNLEVMQNSGFLLLKCLEGSGQYEFPHLTFQEYFAGRWLAKQLLSDDEGEKEEAESFFEKNKYEPQYGRMFSFLAGTVSKKEGQKGIRKLLTLTNKGAQDIVGVQHLRLQIRLLHEWLCVGKGDMDAKMSQLEQEFQVRDRVLECFNRGIRLVDNRLLLMLTTVLQEFTAVARYVCPDFLDTLLAACKDEDEDVRWAAINALGEVIKADPTLAKDCLDTLLDACKDGDEDVRGAAIKALGGVIKAAPTLAPDFLDTLLAAYKDGYFFVRRAAIQALGEVIKAAPTLFPKCLNTLLAACKDKNGNEDVRWAAMEALVEVIKADPTLAKDCLDTLLAACKDKNGNEDVRLAAMEALVEGIKADPKLAPKCLETLLAACKDKYEDRDVRWAAMEALGEVIKADPMLAPKCVDTLLAACKDGNEDEFVRVAARKALGEVIKADPTLAKDCLDTFLAACKDKNGNEDVRWDAMEALGEVIKADPTLAQDCLKILLEACKDKYEDRDVRRAAIEALGEVIKAAPTLAPKCLETLLAACKDGEDRYVRRAAMEALGEVIKADPTRAKDCLDTLLAACKDKNGNEFVRWAAIKALGEVIKADTTLAKACLETLLAACKDENRYVRRDAIKALGEVIKADPTLAPKCLETLLAACKDENEEVRRDAIKALGEVIKADPTLAKDCLDTLLDACKDGDEDVRGAAMEALGEVIKADPTLAKDCLDTLLDACKDENRYVRRVVMDALVEVIKAAPTLAKDCLEPLLAACNDEDKYVRRAAMKALGKVIKADPTLAKDCLDTLLAARNDQNEFVRWAAINALEEFSLKQLIEHYWETKNEELIPIIMPKCYQTPLVVTDSNTPNYQKIVLYDTAGNPVSWNKPQKEVEELIKLMKSLTGRDLFMI